MDCTTAYCDVNRTRFVFTKHSGRIQLFSSDESVSAWFFALVRKFYVGINKSMPPLVLLMVSCQQLT